MVFVACPYNPGVQKVDRRNVNSDTGSACNENKCKKCGWNPAVAEERKRQMMQRRNGNV